MSEEKRQNHKTQLARAVANGQSVAEWSRQSGVAERTAYRWAKEAKFKSAVNSHRRKAIDQSLGRLTDKLASATDAIVNLSQTAQSESVRLAAIKAMFANVVAISNFTSLVDRVTALEEQARARTGSAGGIA
jgi:predicted site-specific integrase-resolvase